MSTYAERHDGLDRVLRGLGFIFSELVSTLVKPVRRLSGRTLRHLETAAAVTPDNAPDVASQHEPAPRRSLFERFRESRARRAAEREFEALMWLDPRMRSEWEAMRDRAESAN